MDINIQYLTRFDLMAKYIYIKFKDLNINTNFHIELYHNHIITFNNCWEYPGTKKNINDFYKSFDNLIYNIKNNGFDKNYPIPIGKNNIIINGSHRLITCFYYKINPIFIKKKEIGNINYNYKYFLYRDTNKKFDIKYTDYMALEYIKLNNNMRCMIIYPSAYENANFNIIESIINNYGIIYYDKIVLLNKNGINNLIKEMYRDEQWIGGTFPKGYSPGGKAQLCVNNKCNKIRIYLFHMNDLTKLIELKEKCRNLFRLGKHSLHISDYSKDTFRIAASLLNENSIHFLNNGTNDISENTKKLLINYFKLNKNNEDNIIITEINNNKINYILANEDDDKLYNPINFYYFNGYKIYKDINLI